MTYHKLQAFIHTYPLRTLFLCGAFYSLGYAPIGLWPVSLVTLALVFHILRQAEAKKLGRYMFTFTFAHILISMHWVPRTFYVDTQSLWAILYLGIPALFGMAMVIAALQGTITAAFCRFTPTKLRSLCIVISALTTEYLRHFPPITMPWHPFGIIFSESLPLSQLASLGGIWALSLLTLIAAAMLLKSRNSAIFSLILIASIYSWGIYRLAQAPNTLANPQTTIRLVQANIPTLWHWHRTGNPQLLPRQLDLSKTDNPNVTAVIWPETALADPLNFRPELVQELTNQLPKNQSLILGYLDFTPAKNNTWQAHNTLGVLKNGEITSTYHKHILVPFGESIPFASILEPILKPLALDRGRYAPGHTPVALKLNNLKVLPLICYEAIFSIFTTKNTIDKDFILNVTNDSWYDYTVGPAQHAALAKLRSIETGLPLVRVGNTGLTGVWDGYGRNVTLLPPHQRRAKNINIPSKNNQQTAYTKLINFTQNR